MRGEGGDTICALATPPGDGALGILRLSGPSSYELLCRASWKRRRFKPWCVQLVTLVDPQSGVFVDRVLATYMAAPRSYTGEDVVEISGHGGRLNMRRLQALFLGLGARRAEPGEFTRRAFINGRLDLTQAEAVLTVITARGERALRNAQAVLQGELGKRVREMRAELVAVAAVMEAGIDFAEEEGIEGEIDSATEALERVTAAADALAETYEQGQRLSGIAVALVGAVNAGKSSLLNVLLGGTRAVVSEEEGTTRDYLEAEVQWEGLAVTLVDTAGQRGEALCNALERQGRVLGEERASRCDVVVEVVDLATGKQREEASACSGARVIAANKIDLLSAVERERRVSSLRAACGAGVVVVPVSALRGEGLPELREAIIEQAVGTAAAQEGMETVQITSGRHHDALRRTSREVSAVLRADREGMPPELAVEHVRSALIALGEITGESFTEEVLDAIFSRFCIGK